MKVKIYCLYEPHTLKIRYIGRTKSTLNKRLSEHITNSKSHNKYSSNKNGSYKTNWINKLLKSGIRPKIRLLIEVEGWEYSHQVERELIIKHLERHSLVNGDDRGPGKLSKNPTEESKQSRINSLKKLYSKEENKTNFYSTVYVYHRDGSFYKEFKSVSFAAEELGIESRKISSTMSKFNNKGAKINPKEGYYFSTVFYERHPLGDQELYQRNHKKIVTIDKVSKEEKVFFTVKSFADFYGLNHWDMHQYRQNIYTKRLIEVLEKIEIEQPT